MSIGEFRPMTVSPFVSPQLNEAICGCRCGCGCGCAGDGNDGSERLSDSTTAFGTSDSEDGENRSLTDHGPSHVGDRVISPRAISHQMIIWLFEGYEDFQSRNLILASLLNGNDEEVTRDQPLGSPSLRNRNDAATGIGNVPTISPGPGIGGWSEMIPEGNRDERGQGVYILTPLRLSAEYQHARGKMVEHMLIPDEAHLGMGSEQD
ncbi:hypothetical protein E8E13_005781 [Curvularia kusanoi]|uniref:Uncharacterized protein n=1 Tax=Curvularia kusanoi TaxID=90978 RepID=A0A9P4TDB3_CURKU|nr:hypothetical protein E8E13_005781 [Curvularia kusanoi]